MENSPNPQLVCACVRRCICCRVMVFACVFLNKLSCDSNFIFIFIIRIAFAVVHFSSSRYVVSGQLLNDTQSDIEFGKGRQPSIGAVLSIAYDRLAQFHTFLASPICFKRVGSCRTWLRCGSGWIVCIVIRKSALAVLRMLAEISQTIPCNCSELDLSHK